MASQPPLVQFVVLSMLLHALFIVLFGAPSGGSREGRAMWGSLKVLLTDPISVPSPSLKLDRGIGAEIPGIAATSTPVPPRPAAVRAKPQPPLRLSPSKEITPPRVTPEARRAAPPAETELRPAEPVPPPPEPRVEPLPVQPLFTPLPRPERTVIPELKSDLLPTVPTPPADEPVPPAPEPPPPPAPPTAAPRVEVPPAEAPPIPAPILQPVQPAAPEPVPTPPVERAPVEAPVVPVPPLERIAPQKVEPSSSNPENAAPRGQLAPPPPAIERAEPRPPERELPAKAEPASRAPATAPPLRTPDFFMVPRDSIPAAPDAGKAPSIDLDAVRKRAREIAREGTGQRALLPFPMPPAPERKSKEEIALEKARKPDCQTAYKDLGLLAVVPLLANEFGEGSCRWR